MSRFLEDAQRIFETAQSVSAAGQAVTEFTLLIGAEGDVQMLADSDWPLERLLEERGARTAYRVWERHGKVSLDGRTGRQSCRLESQSPRQLARRLLGTGPGACLTASIPVNRPPCDRLQPNVI